MSLRLKTIGVLCALLSLSAAALAGPPSASAATPKPEAHDIDMHRGGPSWDVRAPGASARTHGHSVVRGAGATFEFTYVEPVRPELKRVVEEAGRRWGAVLRSARPIVVLVRDVPDLSFTDAYAVNVIRNSSSLPEHPSLIPGVMYPMALLNAITGQDISPAGTPITNIRPECVAIGCDLVASFGGPDWYFGLDGKPGAGQYDAVSVAEHEIGHGLGFDTDALVTGALGSFSPAPTVYDRFLVAGDGVRLTSIAPDSTELAARIQSNDLFFDGPSAQLAFGSPVPLFAPDPYVDGTSLSHVSAASLPGSMMVSAAQSPLVGKTRTLDTVTLGILADLGWPMRNRLSVEGAKAPERDGAQLRFTLRLAQPAVVGVKVRYASEDASATAGRDYTAVTGVAEIPAGRSSTVVSVPVLPDRIKEPRETMVLRLTLSAGATLGTTQARGTIVDER
ncbi:MAG: hypothetical protein JNL54_16255 [Kineosporiaceae bacterium]|nr:hypothetical protein [Kineosporiaceae bacterium]